MPFEGFPAAALDFYDDLEQDNTKTFWEANKSVYEASVKAPILALGDALEDEFGAAKVFRPHRDVRFSKDKTPYKTHQGLYVPLSEATGYYVQVSAPGVMVGVGFYAATAQRIALIREAIDGPDGAELERILATMAGQGWSLGGETVATAPRGYAKDHPRIGLLRHKTMTLGKEYGFAPFIHTAEVAERVRTDWRQATPFLDWVIDHADRT